MDDARKAAHELREEIEAAIPAYEAARTDTTDRDRLIEIGERLAIIAPEVDRLRAEAQELRNKKPVDVEFVEYVETLEKRALQVSGKFFESLANNWSFALFSIPYRRNMGNLRGLSEGARSDIDLGLADVKQFCNHHLHCRFGTSNKTIDGAKQTLSRLLESLSSVMHLANKKEKKS